MKPRPLPPATAIAPNAGPAGARPRVVRGPLRAALAVALGFLAACSPPNGSRPGGAVAATTPTIDPRYSQPVPDLDQLQPNENPQTPFEIALAQRVDRLSQTVAQQSQAIEALTEQLQALPKPIEGLHRGLTAVQRQTAENQKALEMLNQAFAVYGRGFHSLPAPTPSNP